MEPTLKYHPLHVCDLTPIPMKLGGGPCMLGSLTGAVSSIWGTLAVTSDVHSAVCWKLRLLAVVDFPPQADLRYAATVKQCRIRRYQMILVKMRPVRTISREVLVTPQRLNAEHPDMRRDGDTV